MSHPWTNAQQLSRNIKRPSSTTIRRDKSLYSCGATLFDANPSRPLMHTNICGILITEILLRLTYWVSCSARPQKPIQNTIPVAITPSAALLKESRHSYYFFLTGLSLTISFGLEIVNIYSPIQPYHFFAIAKHYEFQWILYTVSSKKPQMPILLSQ